MSEQSELATLQDEVRQLRAALAESVGESAGQELQLQRYAADLRETFKVAAYGLQIARAMDLELATDPATEFGFLLHDVGKVAITDSILHKPGPLTGAERAVMEQHPLIGARIVADIPFLAGDATAVVRSHHERWDGGGYPDGLAETDIPLAARIFSVADVLDALTTTRPYRTASPIAEARARILNAAGRHFDPSVVAAFGEVPDAVFTEIAAAVR